MKTNEYIQGQEDLIQVIKQKVRKLDYDVPDSNFLFDVLDILQTLKPLEPKC